MHRTYEPMALVRAFALAGCVLAIALAAGGCPAPDGSTPPGDGSMPPTNGSTPPPDSSGTPMPTGAQLAARIIQTDPYQQWSQFSDRQGTLPSVLPHGPMSRVFINDKVEAALANFGGQLPEDAIIVKENVGTSSNVTEAALTVMWKVKGFDSANNDWFWANMSPDGTITAEGKVQSCTTCHGGVRSNDFVFVHRFR